MMNRSFKYQTIVHCGHPAFVLVPWEDWNRIKHILKLEKARASGIPQQVVEAHVNNNESLIKAWREYLGLTQKELAERMGMSQAAVAKFERPGARLRDSTIKKLAVAFKLEERQLLAIKLMEE
jgi:ribosome-binding protein aMBF1 (putative translation factor)